MATLLRLLHVAYSMIFYFWFILLMFRGVSNHQIDFKHFEDRDCILLSLFFNTLFRNSTMKWLKSKSFWNSASLCCWHLLFATSSAALHILMPWINTFLFVGRVCRIMNQNVWTVCVTPTAHRCRETMAYDKIRGGSCRGSSWIIVAFLILTCTRASLGSYVIAV